MGITKAEANVIIDNIANRNPLKKIDPMEKFIFSIGLFITMQFCDNCSIHIINTIFLVVFLIILVKISAKELLRLYRGVVAFILFTNIIFILNGTDWILVTLKAIDSITIMYLLFCSTPVTHITLVMAKLRFPKIIQELFLLIYRFIFLFMAIKDEFAISQKSRLGYRNLKTSYRSIALIASNLFHKVFVYSKKINMAVESRLGRDFIFFSESFEKNKKFRLAYIYLITISVVIFYDKF